MRGFKCPDAAARFCRGHDGLRQFFRVRTRHNQHVPAVSRRIQHLRRIVAVLAIMQMA